MAISKAKRAEAAKKAARTRKRNAAIKAAEAAKMAARRKRSRAAKKAAATRKRTMKRAAPKRMFYVLGLLIFNSGITKTRSGFILRVILFSLSLLNG